MGIAVTCWQAASNSGDRTAMYSKNVCSTASRWLRVRTWLPFSVLQVTEHEVVEDGDALVIRGQNSAVHSGRFLGIEPTGRRVSWEYLDMYRAGPDGRLNWHFLATDWNQIRLQLLGQAPDLPITPTRRAVQAELAGQPDQPHPRPIRRARRPASQPGGADQPVLRASTERTPSARNRT